jgi:hypothetical protein
LQRCKSWIGGVNIDAAQSETSSFDILETQSAACSAVHIHPAATASIAASIQGGGTNQVQGTVNRWLEKLQLGMLFTLV